MACGGECACIVVCAAACVFSGVGLVFEAEVEAVAVVDAYGLWVKCSLYTGMLLPAAPIAGDVFSDQAVSPVCCNLWACLLSSEVRSEVCKIV